MLLTSWSFLSIHAHTSLLAYSFPFPLLFHQMIILVVVHPRFGAPWQTRLLLRGAVVLGKAKGRINHRKRGSFLSPLEKADAPLAAPMFQYAIKKFASYFDITPSCLCREWEVCVSALVCQRGKLKDSVSLSCHRLGSGLLLS